MENKTLEFYQQLLGVDSTTILIIFFLFIIWVLIWKGTALWKSARKGSKLWFVLILILNTAGILPILYIFLISKINLDSDSTSNKKSRKKKKSK